MLEILRGHGRLGDMASVFDLMQRQFINRNLSTYFTIFKGLDIRGGDMASVFDLMKVYSYIGLIHLLLQSRCCNETLEVYRRMVSEGIKPSLKTYSALMVALGKRRDTETVMSLLREMESLGLKPNIYTFIICIRALGRAGKIDSAKELFLTMKSSSHKPDQVTYITLLDKAFVTLNTMRKKGVAPNLHTYNSLIDFHGTLPSGGRQINNIEEKEKKGARKHALELGKKLPSGAKLVLI